MSALNSAKFLNNLRHYFSATCTIQQITGTTQNSFGEDQDTWGDLHADIACSPVFAVNMRIVGHLIRNQNESYLESLRQLALKGVYRDIDTTMQVTIDSVTYTIELAYTDTQAIYTTLAIRRVEVTSG